MNSFCGLNKYRLLLFVLLVFGGLFLQHTFAQNSVASPYSRYGIGEITSKGFGQSFAMGGTVVSIQSDSLPYFFINNGNPASYASMRLTTADLGVNYTRLTLSNSTSKSTVNTASIGNVAMAFPMKKWCGASIGIIPYSSVGYKVSDQNEIPNVGEVNYLYEGSGGLNQAYLGFGFKPFLMHSKNFPKSEKCEKLKLAKDTLAIRKIVVRRKALQDLSFGGNVSYLFGGIENIRRSIFPSGNLSFFNTKATTNTRVNAIYFDYGMQYSYTFHSVKKKNWVKDTVGKQLHPTHPRIKKELKESVKIMFGATYSAETNLNASIDSLSVNYFYLGDGSEKVKDTVELIENTKGKIKFPMSFGFGIGIKKGERLLVSADFAIQNWSNYQLFNQSQGLKNSMRVSLGTQYVPNYKANGKGNYPKRIHYRVGVRYAQTALELKSTQLTEYAVSLGVGLPVGRNYLLQNFSMVNLGVEFGQRGTIANGLIKEDFFKATISFTINDRWFVKPKID